MLCGPTSASNADMKQNRFKHSYGYFLFMVINDLLSDHWTSQESLPPTGAVLSGVTCWMEKQFSHTMNEWHCGKVTPPVPVGSVALCLFFY